MAEKRGKAPAYQWFPKDAETDEAYRLMTCEELGVYERLRDCQWLEGSLPAELEKLSMLIGHRMTVRRLEFIWPKIAPCFPDDGTGRLANPRLEEQRTQLASYLATKKLAGKAGGLAKAKQTASITKISPVAKRSSASATASPSASATAEVLPLTPSAFERFWHAYPRKVGKDGARKAFERRHPTDALVAEMLAALDRQRHSADWRRDGGQYIPHPSTWLNDGRWQDEPRLVESGLVSARTETNLANQAEALKLIERGAFGDR